MTTTEHQKPTLQHYYEQIMHKSDGRCHYCKQPFLLNNLQHYDHEAGWPLRDNKHLQWIYLHCSKCGYEWAIWKLGIPRYNGEKK